MSDFAEQNQSSPPNLPRIRRPLRLPAALLFWLAWLAAAAGAAYFYYDSPDFSAITGVGDTTESHATAPELARIMSIEVSLGQRVRKGQVIVSFDTAALQGELEVAAAQIAKAQADLTAGMAILQRDAANDRLAFEKAFEITDAGMLQAQVQADVDRAAAEGLRKQIAWWHGRVQQQLVGEQPLIELRSELASVEKRIESRSSAVRDWQQRVQRVQGRLQEFSKVLPASGDATRPELAPLHAQIEVSKALLAQVDARRQLLVVRAPFDGVVHRVLLQPGDVAIAGQSVLTLRKPEVDRVIGYAIGAVARRLSIGGMVRVERRDGTGMRLRGHVLGFGGVAPLPLQLQSVPPRAPLAAEEIIIALDDGTVLPGEPVDVEFTPGVLNGKPGVLNGKPANAAVPQRASSSPAQVAAAPGPPVGTPPQPPGPKPVAPPVQPPPQVALDPVLVTDVQVPAALQVRTRLELSALVWLPERDRYLVVSDDTGLKGGADSGAPWLFALRRDGHLDPEPWPIHGLRRVDDLEALTRGPDGALWLLASQSVSRKGKRSEARSLMARLELRGDQLHATASANLAAALGNLKDPQALSTLGLTKRDGGLGKRASGFDRELDIEGLAFEGKALLLALKHPLDSGDTALIWKLDEPEKLLHSGQLSAGQLTVWARLPLRVGPAGALLAAGVADLLRLPDGRLLVLATALGDADEGHSERGMHSALLAVDGAPLAPKISIVSNFNGLHAEGLALGPDPGKLAVVFDRGVAPPQWAMVAFK